MSAVGQALFRPSRPRLRLQSPYLSDESDTTREFYSKTERGLCGTPPRIVESAVPHSTLSRTPSPGDPGSLAAFG